MHVHGAGSCIGSTVCGHGSSMDNDSLNRSILNPTTNINRSYKCRARQHCKACFINTISYMAHTIIHSYVLFVSRPTWRRQTALHWLLLPFFIVPPAGGVEKEV